MQIIDLEFVCSPQTSIRIWVQLLNDPAIWLTVAHWPLYQVKGEHWVQREEGGKVYPISSYDRLLNPIAMYIVRWSIRGATSTHCLWAESDLIYLFIFHFHFHNTKFRTDVEKFKQLSAWQALTFRWANRWLVHAVVVVVVVIVVAVALQIYD